MQNSFFVALLLCGFAAAMLSAGDLAKRSFSGALSQAKVTPEEQVVLNYTLSEDGQWGVINNWWVAGDIDNDGIVLSFYIDGEATASIVLRVDQACGAGFGSPGHLYSSEYFAKLAKTSGWSNKIPIPFQKSVVVTFKGVTTNTIWVWVRGVENLPIALSPGERLPPSARLELQTIEGSFQPYSYLDLVNVGKGRSGQVLATALSLTSSNLNVLEGCYYLFPSNASTWTSGMNLLATGTEDYFESAFYFNGGLVDAPFSGVTFLDTNGPKDQPNRVSMYKIHGPHDPIVFSDGFRLTWRVGDQTNSGGLKCTCFPGGSTGCSNNGNPQVTNITSYAWVYTWDNAPQRGEL